MPFQATTGRAFYFKVMIYQIDSKVAKDVGFVGAILFWHIAFWIKKNKANGKNFHDGEYWTYSSVKGFSEYFEDLTEAQILQALKNLIAKNYLKTGEYNKARYDRTKWYAFGKIGKSICENSQMTFVKINKPIPDIKTDNNKTDNTSMSSCQMTPAKKASIEADKIAELFNSTCVSLAKIKLLSKSRMSQVEARLKELKQTPETYVSFLQELFARIERSDFLTNRGGLNRNNWRASFDWIFAPRNFLKVIEGNYDNKGANAISKLTEPDGWQVYFIKTYTTEPLPASWADVPESKKITILQQINK